MAFGFAGLLGGGPVPDVEMPDGLPVSGGQGSPLMDAYLALQGQRLKDAFTAPRDAYTGDLQVMGPDGHPTAEAMERANGLAGLAMTGSMPFGAPAGAIRSFGGAPKEDPIAALEAALGFSKPAAPGANRAADDAIANLQRGLEAGAAPTPAPADPLAALEAALSRYTEPKGAPAAPVARELYAPAPAAPRAPLEAPSALEQRVLQATQAAPENRGIGKNIWDVRDQLPDVAEADLRDAMMGLQRKGFATLSQYTDPKGIRGKTGIDIGGGDPRHLIIMRPQAQDFLTAPFSPVIRKANP